MTFDATRLALDCASSLDVQLSPEGLAAVAARAGEMLEREGSTFAFAKFDNTTTDFRDGALVDVEIGTWLTRLIREHAIVADRETVPKSQPAPRNAFERAKAEARAARQGEKISQAREAMAQGNPWSEGKINRTHQAIIEIYLPEEAANLRQAAGK